MLANKLKSTAEEYETLLSGFFQNSFVIQENELLASSIEEAEFFSVAEELGFREKEQFKNWSHILSLNSRTGEKPDSGYLKERKDLYESEEYFDQILAPQIRLKFECKIKSHSLYSTTLEMLANMYYCSIAFSQQSFFHTRLAEIFSRGGLLCGWRGKYPQGDIIVFAMNSRPNEKQSA